MKKIILLEGQKSCGKTTTLNLLHDHLVLSGATHIKSRTPFRGEGLDFQAVLDCSKVVVPSVVIRYTSVAIFSLGDTVNHCCKAIEDYTTYDVLVMAWNNTFGNRARKMLTNAIGTTTPVDHIIKTSLISSQYDPSPNITDCQTIVSYLGR